MLITKENIRRVPLSQVITVLLDLPYHQTPPVLSKKTAEHWERLANISHDEPSSPSNNSPVSAHDRALMGRLEPERLLGAKRGASRGATRLGDRDGGQRCGQVSGQRRLKNTRRPAHKAGVPTTSLWARKDYLLS